MVALSIVYGVACLIYRFGLIYMVGLDHKDFSSIPYGVTYSNIVLDALPPNLVRVPPLEYLMSLSLDYTSYPPAGYIVSLYIKYI